MSGRAGYMVRGVLASGCVHTYVVDREWALAMLKRGGLRTVVHDSSYRVMERKGQRTSSRLPSGYQYESVGLVICR